MLPALRYDGTMTPAPTAPINRLDALFDRFFGDDGGFTARAWSWAPVAMWHDDDRVYVEAELPGVSAQDVEVTVHDGTLFIRGERKAAEGRRYLYNGRMYGRFERAITLPEAVDAGAVEATLADGVLRLELPKSPEAKPKRIEVKVG